MLTEDRGLPLTLWAERRSAVLGVSGNGACDASQLKPFGEEVNLAIAQHALDCYPNECCGLIVDGKYMPCENVHENPMSYFAFDEKVLQTFATRIQGMAHSHPKTMPWPSLIDMEQQDLWDIPWAIASVVSDDDNPPYCMDLFWFGDCLPRLPLVGRVFRPSVQDCYTLARDYYFSKGIELPTMPRHHEWWMDDEKTGRKRQNLFVDMLDASGFEIINVRDAKVGDGFACPYGTSTICHCGVLVSEDHVLHHMALAASNIELAPRWIKRTVEAGKFFRVRNQT